MLVALPVGGTRRLVWARSVYPSLDNPDLRLVSPLDVAGLGIVSPQLRHCMFLDNAGLGGRSDSAGAPPRSDGIWPAVERIPPWAPSEPGQYRHAPATTKSELYSPTELLQIFNENLYQYDEGQC